MDDLFRKLGNLNNKLALQSLDQYSVPKRVRWGIRTTICKEMSLACATVRSTILPFSRKITPADTSGLVDGLADQFVQRRFSE